MEEFVHEAAATRVVFGTGALDRVPAECEALGMRRVLVIAGGSAADFGDRVAERLGPAAAGRFGRVEQHVPEQLVTDATVEAKETGADGLCSIGGGSATGLAKAVAATLDLPIVAVPTTYAGSEATAVYGVTGERKRTRTDPRVRARTAVYDPVLSTRLPSRATACSGFNALAHAVAALAGPVYDPVARLYAAEAIGVVARALPVAVREPGRLDARGELLWAAWLAGSAVAATGTGVHHRLCHLIGGNLWLPHAEVHAALLPHTAARDDSLALDRVAGALGADDAVAALRQLARDVGAPQGLAEVGFPRDRLDPLARQAAATIGARDAAWFAALLHEAHNARPERRPS